ncbi:MAG: exo-beta-N-acetylmuramidase NamZ domain-containing protein, partial [Fimbriimonadaceae bacterium]
MEVLLMLATVLCGIDVLEENSFDTLSGRNVGLITNHTGRTIDGRYTADVLHEAENVNLVALFAPEHGIRGELDEENIGDLTDPDTGLPIYSLYNRASENRFRPSDEQLEGIDTLVFDIQDIGARFYTYVGTMGYAMEAAAENGLKFVVLDRPNPINGVDVEGPVADEDYLGLTAFQPMPTRHGMTAGELALMFKDDLNLDLDLEVVWCENWKRDMYWDETGLTWVNPSPNMRTFTQALLYPGIALVEGTPISVGRGTDTPFEL